MLRSRKKDATMQNVHDVLNTEYLVNEIKCTRFNHIVQRRTEIGKDKRVLSEHEINVCSRKYRKSMNPNYSVCNEISCNSKKRYNSRVLASIMIIMQRETTIARFSKKRHQVDDR